MEETKKTFCDAIALYRKSKNITQHELAEAIGISDKTYSKWETGENEPSLSSMIKLAEFYGVSPSQFFAKTNQTSTETAISNLFDGLSPHDTVQKSFEIHFHAVRQLAKRALFNSKYYDIGNISIPENRVKPNPSSDGSFTAYADADVYEMMYNGSDANIALSLFPHAEYYSWLRIEREQLSEYLSFIGNDDFLKCIPFMANEDFAIKYTAEYLAEAAKIDTKCAEELLHKCVELEICSMSIVHIGDKTKEVFQTEADQMLIGILTLAHLSLPMKERSGCYYFNRPARQIMVEGTVK